MTRLYTNNYSTVLSAAITDIATTMDVESVAALPAIGSGETCQLTITDGASIEIVTATAVSSNTITMTREAEGTTGTAFGLGSTVELRATALSFIDPAGVIDFGAATSLEIPNGATPTVAAAGEIAVDTTVADNTGMIKFHDGVEELSIPGIPTANLTTVDGDIIAYNATNDEFEMVTPAGGGGGGDYVKILTQAASASATINFTDLSTTYRDFVILVSDAAPSSDGVQLCMRTSSNNGSSYDSGASDYMWVRYQLKMHTTPTETIVGDNGDGFISMNNLVGSATNEGCDARIQLCNPQGTRLTRVLFDTVMASSLSTVGERSWGGGQRASAADVDAIQFFFSTGNITSGDFTLYGITK